MGAAILKYRIPFTMGNISDSLVELLDPDNGEGRLAVGTALLSGLDAEIIVLPDWRSPSLKTDFRLHRATVAIASLSC